MNNQDENKRENLDEETDKPIEDFEPNEEAQKLGGGDNDEGGGDVEIGNFGEDDFMKTDQSTTQAAPGQTATFENQGGSK